MIRKFVSVDGTRELTVHTSPSPIPCICLMVVEPKRPIDKLVCTFYLKPEDFGELAAELFERSPTKSV